MPGQNAFAFNGTAFVPENRTLTAGISVFSPAPTRVGIPYAYTLNTGLPATQVWQGYPPTPSAPSFRNVLTGAFPYYANSLQVDWTCASSPLIASFTVFVKVGVGGSYAVAGTATAAARTFNYGNISADTSYYFYIRANGISGINLTGPESNTSISSPTAPTNLRETSISSSSLTWTWDFPANKFQRFYVYRYNGSTYIWNTEVLPTQAATSATHTWGSLPERTAHYIRVIGLDYNGFWSSNIDDGATTSNAAPSAPFIGASATDVASEPAGNTNTAASATRYFAVTVDPSEDPIFAEAYLEVSSDDVNWSAVTSWTNNTTSKSHNYAVTVTSTSSGVNRYFRARQRDTENLYSGWVYTGIKTSDTLGSTYVSSSYNVGAGDYSNEWVAGENLGVGSNWAVTSTLNDDTVTYGGDQAFDGNNSKSWVSKSTTNSRIRITFPIRGNWVNGISGIEFWPAARYTTYISISADGGTTWFGSTNTPGTSNPYVEVIASANVNPNVINTVDINPDRYKINNSAGTTTNSWAVRLEFVTTANTSVQCNQINVKQITQNYVTVDNSYYRYW